MALSRANLTGVMSRGRLVEQLFQTVDEMLDREGLDEVFGIGLRQEQIDFCFRREARDENETVSEMRAKITGLQVEFIAAEFRHHDVANHRVVLVGFHFGERLFTVVGDIDEKIFVRQNPLERGGQLLVVIDEEEGLEFDGVRRAHGQIRLIVKIHRLAYEKQMKCQPSGLNHGKKLQIRA
jgi:hypothetical protein